LATGKRQITSREIADRKLRRLESLSVFMNGKQKRSRRPAMVEGIESDEFIRRNADPIWVHQNEMWELIEPTQSDTFVT
jgi:hypothetical protein